MTDTTDLLWQDIEREVFKTLIELVFDGHESWEEEDTSL